MMLSSHLGEESQIHFLNTLPIKDVFSYQSNETRLLIMISACKLDHRPISVMFLRSAWGYDCITMVVSYSVEKHIGCRWHSGVSKHSRSKQRTQAAHDLRTPILNT
jgi:hypothetical protein